MQALTYVGVRVLDHTTLGRTRLGGDGVTSPNLAVCSCYSTAFMDSTICIALSFAVINTSMTPANSSVSTVASA